FRFSGRKLEADLPVFQFQVSGEWATFLRNELRQQVGLAGRDEFLDLLFRNFPVQNRFAHTEGAGLFLRNGVLAGIRAIEHIDLALFANRTKSKCFVLLSVDLDWLIVTVLTEVERGFEFVAQFHNRVELAANLAAESLERTDLAFS